MDNLIQNIESTITNTVSAIEPKVHGAVVTITPKLNATTLVISKAFNVFLDWIAAHPKVSLVVIIFILGFLCGILF